MDRHADPSSTTTPVIAPSSMDQVDHPVAETHLDSPVGGEVLQLPDQLPSVAGPPPGASTWMPRPRTARFSGNS